jgi:hypothetical protein
LGSHTLEAYSQEGLHWGPTTYAIPAGGFTWTLYMPAGTGCVKLVNNTGYTMYHWYMPVSPNGCSYASWGTDALGTYIVPSGSSFIISNVAAGYRDFEARTSGSVYYYWWLCSAYVTAGITNVWTIP